MTVLNLPDLAKKIGVSLDPVTGKEDWSRTLQRALMTGAKKGQTPLIPTGTKDDPTLVRIPELYNAISPIEPYCDGLDGRRLARHIHLGDDKETGFHFRTFGPGHDGEVERDVELATAHPAFAKVLNDKYRNRFLLGPRGGYGWKAKMKLVGPKLPSMPWRSPSGGGARNCFEAQHAFRGMDFGRDRTDNERAAGVTGWDLSECDFGWVWGDAISPATFKPNDRPCEGLYAVGAHFHDLGRMGIRINALSEWHVTWSTFGNGIPSSIIHAETGGGKNVMRDGLLDYCVIQSGGYTVHISGETAELDGLTVDHCVRRDRQMSVSIDMGPKLDDGTRRGRNITVTNNRHDRWVDGSKLAYFQGCEDVEHSGNSGPIPKKLDLSRTLYDPAYHHGSVRLKLGPNNYRRLA